MKHKRENIAIRATNSSNIERLTRPKKTTMKAIIQITSNYGFDHNWTLHIEMKGERNSFYLGQDVKFCNRVLGMTPREVIETIGTDDIQSAKGNRALAKFIVKTLKPTKHTQPWELCAE